MNRIFAREWIGPGGPRGLQILTSGATTVRGGFDSHTFPPNRLTVGGGLFAAFLLLALSIPFSASAEQPAAGGSVASPFWSCVRSAVVPGWGQLHNGSSVKAIALFSMQSYLFARYSIAERRGSFYRHELNNPESVWGPGHLQNKYDDFRDTRNDMVWWMTIFGLYSLIDAYVDAHMAGFDQEVAEVQRLTWNAGPRGGEGDLALQLTVAW